MKVKTFEEWIEAEPVEVLAFCGPSQLRRYIQSELQRIADELEAKIPKFADLSGREFA